MDTFYHRAFETLQENYPPTLEERLVPTFAHRRALAMVYGLDVFIFAQEHQLEELIPAAGFEAISGIDLYDILDWDIPRPILNCMIVAQRQILSSMSSYGPLMWSEMLTEDGSPQCASRPSCLRALAEVRQNWLNPDVYADVE
jgi:hypothetical protein